MSTVSIPVAVIVAVGGAFMAATGWLIKDYFKNRDRIKKLFYWAFGNDEINGDGYKDHIEQELDTIDDRFGKVHNKIDNNNTERKREFKLLVSHLERISDKVDAVSPRDVDELRDYVEEEEE